MLSLHHANMCLLLMCFEFALCPLLLFALRPGLCCLVRTAVLGDKRLRPLCHTPTIVTAVSFPHTSGFTVVYIRG